MPWSDNDGKEALLGRLEKLIAPTSTFLDIGAGAGFYGKWLRSHGVSADAVEVHGPYIKRFHLLTHYRSVFIGRIQDYQPKWVYTCAILGDVLEHLTVTDSQALLARLPVLCKTALISVPWNYPQGACENNDYEIHLQPDLTPSVMRDRYPALSLIYEGRVVGVYGWEA